MIRARFYIPWEHQDPVIDVGEYPWWITGQTENGYAVIVAYEGELLHLLSQWPHMFIDSLEYKEVEEIVYTDRFPNTCSWWRVK